MPKLKPERSYFRFPISLLDAARANTLAPLGNSDPEAGRIVARYVIAHTLATKGGAQVEKVGAEYAADHGPSDYEPEVWGRSIAGIAGDWLLDHKPGTLPDGWEEAYRKSMENGFVPSPFEAAVALALAPGRNFSDRGGESVSDGGRFGGLGIKAGPLPNLGQLHSDYMNAAAHVGAAESITGRRSMNADVRADFVRDLAAGRMTLRRFRVLAAITAKLGEHDYTLVPVTDEHLTLLASGFSSQEAFEATRAHDEAEEELRRADAESEESRRLIESDPDAYGYILEPLPIAELALSETQTRYTRRKLCARDGVFVSYLRARRYTHIGHPKGIARHVEEWGEDRYLTLCVALGRLVEAKYDRGEEREHAQRSAAEIIRAEKKAAQARREREHAERLRAIEESEAVSSPAVDSDASRRQSVGKVSPYREAVSENQYSEKLNQKSPSTAGFSPDARLRSEDQGSEKAEHDHPDRQPETPPPNPLPDPSSTTPTVPADPGSVETHSEGEAERFVVLDHEPGANPDPAPTPADAAPPTLWRIPDGMMGGAAPAEPQLPTTAPPGSLTGAQAHALAVQRGEAETWPLIGRGGSFEEAARLADGSARYRDRDRATVAAERREMEREQNRGAAGAAS